MKNFNYERLTNIAKNNPPYRGSKNRFPLGMRRHNNKYFLVREEDGQRVFDIVYGHRWSSRMITKEEYDRLALTGNETLNKYHTYNDKGQLIPDVFTYHHYEKRENILGVVRPDDTFEFTATYYGQGDRGFLSDFSYGYFTTDSRRGGMLYKLGVTKQLPIWRGMKINTQTVEPTQPYKVVINHVDRKKSKELVKAYEHFFKVSEVMLKSMSQQAAVETAREVLRDAYGEEDAHAQWHGTDELVAFARERINSAPLDAFLLYAMAYQIGRLSYQVRWSNSVISNDESPLLMYANVKRKLSKEIYKENPDIFKEVEYEGGVKYPACDWGVKIIVDGKEVEQL